MEGFEWIDLNHRDEGVIVFRRKGIKKTDDLLIVLNMTPVPRMDWEIELKDNWYSNEVFNSDAERYGGSGHVYNPKVRRKTIDKNEKIYRIIINLPPLAGIILK
jgi:1,4-alpha-glucan branching enzyme